MDKRRHAEKLMAWLRWVVIIPGLAATNFLPLPYLAVMLGLVAASNGLLMYCLADSTRFARNGRNYVMACRILDCLLITCATAQAGSHACSAYLLYWFVLVGMGYVGVYSRTLLSAASIIMFANAFATYYAAFGGPANITGTFVLRSVMIAAGLLVAMYIAKSRSREDQASERGSHLQAILSCGAQLANFRSVHELAHYVLETAVRQTNGVGGELLMVNEESGNLEREAFYSASNNKDVGKPSEERLQAYAKWVMNSGRELMVGNGAQSNADSEIDRDDRPAIAAPLLGQSSISDLGEGVMGVLLVWGYAGENLSDDAMDMLRIFSAIAGAAIVNLKLYTNMQKSFLNTLQSLAKGLEARDEYTRGHSDRVMQVACTIAQDLEVPSERIDLLRNAALLHDIGKIGVPDAILSKAGELTADEWETMRRHSVTSGEICRPLGLPDEVIFLITHHHERLDGKGYPSGLSSTELPFLQRILVVSDTFDAMRSRRPYRDTIPQESLLAELNRCAGRTLDPTVIDALKRLIFRGELDAIYEEHDRMTSGIVVQVFEDQRKAA